MRLARKIKPQLAPWLDLHEILPSAQGRACRRQAITAPDGRPLLPGEAGVLEAYQRIHTGWQAAPAEAGIVPGTLSDLIVAFKDSPEWKKLKPATQSSYARYLDELRAWKGHARVATVPREFVLQVRDKYQATPRMADYIVTILCRLLAWALDRPKRFGLAHNPADKIEKINRGVEYKAWPDSLLRALFAAPHLTAAIKPAVRLGLDSGQRNGYSYHGLRKNAAARLAEAGCSDTQIMAITGH